MEKTHSNYTRTNLYDDFAFRICHFNLLILPFLELRSLYSAHLCRHVIIVIWCWPNFVGFLPSFFVEFFVRRLYPVPRVQLHVFQFEVENLYLTRCVERVRGRLFFFIFLFSSTVHIASESASAICDVPLLHEATLHIGSVQ